MVRNASSLQMLTLCGAALSVACRPQPAPPVPGTTAPGFALAHLDSGGRIVETLEANRGRFVLIEFWATWCHPCLRAHPAIASFAERYKDHGLVTYGILHEDSPTRALAWLQSHGGVQYAELRDDDGAVSRAYGVHALPQMFLIGPDGRVLSHCLGCADFAEDFGATIDSVVSGGIGAHRAH